MRVVIRGAVERSEPQRSGNSRECGVFCLQLTLKEVPLGAHYRATSATRPLRHRFHRKAFSCGCKSGGNWYISGINYDFLWKSCVRVLLVCPGERVRFD